MLSSFPLKGPRKTNFLFLITRACSTARQRVVSGDRHFEYTRQRAPRQTKTFNKNINSNRKWDQVSGFGGQQRTIRSNFGPGENLRPIDWSDCNLKEIHKNVYDQHTAVAQRDQSAVNEWLNKNEISVSGVSGIRPILSFKESTFPEPVIQNLLSDFAEPTAIQSITWPAVLSGYDLVSIAKTGSGKTLGFMLPGIVHTLHQPKRTVGEGPTLLILVPTRELAQQVHDVSFKYSRLMRLNTACCYGGASKNVQADILNRGIDICISTPGRILDFLEGGVTNLRRCSFLVLDEADRMLDMGFEPQIRRVISQIRPDRQTLMFSATWPQEIRQLASDFLDKPIHLNVGSHELAANQNIIQHVDVIEERDKSRRLLELLGEIKKQSESKALIFVSTKLRADVLAKNLAHRKYVALAIHGDKSQQQRNFVLKEFREKPNSILIATDLAARGLDVSDIKYIINYDYPNNSRDYIHRIGRTARGQNEGTSYTFVTPEQRNLVDDLINVLQESKQSVPEELSKLSFRI